ncbi:MAG TPA: FAD-dependent oxidoreductase [Caulobacteraceae bacterium]|nr:FAD-dependent oxidoreductase [Caulobacteraceae bacterium]
MSKPAEVAVIGAGALGLAAAAALARRGARVTVFDPGAYNASLAAAGMISPAFEAALEDASPRTAALYARAADRWPEAAALYCVEFDRSGAAWRGPTEPLLTRMRALGFEARVTGTGLFAPGEGTVDPAQACDRFAAAVTAGGGAFVRGRAERLAASPGGVEVTAAGESWRGDAVVVAAGWRAEGLAVPGLEPLLARVSPIKGQICRLAGGGAALVQEVVRAPGVYVVPRGGEVLVGATMEAGRSDSVAEPEVVERLRRAAVDAVPELGDAVVEGAWAGVRGASPDGLPMVGATALPRVFAALAPRRNGWLFAPLVGRMVADLVMGEDPGADAEVLRTDRFDP